MPGPQDRVGEREPDPESVRPSQARADLTGLRERLERLPPVHPSSPRTADGSRKDTPPGLAGRELPLPGDPGSRTEPDHDCREDGARVGADGSWEWKGRRLTPEQSRIADQALARCRAAEGRDAQGNYTDRGLTPAMRRIEAQLEHGHLADDTEKFALKSPDRFKEKLAGQISDEPGSDAPEISSRISDGIRYTYILAEECYKSAVISTCDVLTAAGFELYERKNAWADETKSYRGVNTSWRDHASDVLFEVQMHTSASWRAKQESHVAYEIIAAQSSTPEERTMANREQERLFREVPVPLGSKEIPTYRKEGW